MPRKRTLIIIYIAEWICLLWTLFHPTVVSVRFWLILNGLILRALVWRMPQYEDVRKEANQAESEGWDNDLSRDIQKRKRHEDQRWASYWTLGAILLLLAIFLPVNGSMNYDEHMPESLRMELVRLHGAEGIPSEPVETVVIEGSTIVVYEQYTYTAERYEKEGLRGMVPRFDEDGAWSCRVEVRRYAEPIYTGRQFASDTAVFYYDAEVSDSETKAVINISSKTMDQSEGALMSVEKLAHLAFLEFQSYRGR
ncbi:MAG: hypothetical protein E7223_02260 [Clostridiales bacterium]|nr:hypothetical protein [Clostridiales bacterium]